MLEITKENYEGYTELAEVKLNGPLAIDKEDAIKLTKVEICIFILFIVLLSLQIGIAVFMPVLIFGYPIAKMRRDYKKNIKKVKEQYKYIDTEISNKELIEALKKVNILRYKKNNNETIHILDKDGYLKFLEEEKIKNEYIDKCDNIKNEVIKNYNIIQDDFVIDEEQLEIAKQKIKTLTK